MNLETTHLIVSLLALLLVFEALRILYYTQRGVISGRNAQKVHKTCAKPKKRMLVTGDCGVVGVGVSDPKLSIVGQIIYDFPDIEITNCAQNSMSLRNLEQQLRQVGTEKFDIILIHIGALDTITFTPQPYMKYLFHKIHQHLVRLEARKVILVSPHNIGSLPLFRFPLNRVYDWHTRNTVRLFIEMSELYSLAHVSLYETRTTDSLRYPQSLFVSDMVHPNDAGHRLWYQKIKLSLDDSLH